MPSALDQFIRNPALSGGRASAFDSDSSAASSCSDCSQSRGPEPERSEDVEGRGQTFLNPKKSGCGCSGSPAGLSTSINDIVLDEIMVGGWTLDSGYEDGKPIPCEPDPLRNASKVRKRWDRKGYSGGRVPSPYPFYEGSNSGRPGSMNCDTFSTKDFYIHDSPGVRLEHQNGKISFEFTTCAVCDEPSVPYQNLRVFGGADWSVDYSYSVRKRMASEVGLIDQSVLSVTNYHSSPNLYQQEVLIRPWERSLYD